MANEASTISTVIEGVKTALADFSIGNLMQVIAGGLAIAVPLVLAWFAFRWIYKKAKGSLKKGG